MTERHLIEELATIIWRKRRVLLAEGAKINEGLKSAVSSAKSVMASRRHLFSVAWRREHRPAGPSWTTTPEELPKVNKSAALDLAATQKAAAILRKGGPNAYTKARRALIQESRDWWDEHVEPKRNTRRPPKGWRIHPRFAGTDLHSHGAGSPIYPGDQGANLGRRAASAPTWRS
jgi:hypothetical protein